MIDDPVKLVVDILTSSLGLVDIACSTCGKVAKGTPRNGPWYCSTDCDAFSLRAERDALREQLHRSATVCPKDGCMLWKDHEENHATAEQVSEALAANSHGKRR